MWASWPWRACIAAGALACVCLASGCSSLPHVNRAAIASQAQPLSADTALGRVVLAAKAAKAARAAAEANDTADTDTRSAPLSGFRLLPLGSFSLDARVQMAQRAQATLDLQYYHFANDTTGRWLLRALRDAAARGVRVRLLIDDLYTGGADPLFLAFAAHTGVEVRLFNPFTVARSGGPLLRLAAAPWALGRTNHRMHNKLFIADGALAQFGGRNIADEYHLRRDSDNFIDVDALAVGALVPALQAQFDRYWNSESVFPLGALAHSADDAATQRAHFEQATGPEKTPPPPPLPTRDVLGRGPIGPELDRAQLDLIWGTARVLADDPDKPVHGSVGGELMASSVTYQVFEAMLQADHELLISSPYFVPGELGLSLLAALRRRGVQVTVLTNSLASTDEALVHLAYARYRPALLGMGVALYELSQQRVKDNMHMFLFGAVLGRLHAKLVVVDGRTSFIGSMNLDPRSATVNTELGALINSPALAAELQQLIDIDRLHSAYALRLAADGDCCEWWVPSGMPGQPVLMLEPDSHWWMRWLGSLLQPLAPENQL